MMSETITFLVTLPLLAAIGALLMRGRFGSGLSILTASSCLVISLILGSRLLSTGPFVYPIGGFGSPLGINLKIDGLNTLMLSTTAVVFMATSFFSCGYLKCSETPKSTFFWPLWLAALAGLNGLFLSLDIFNIYVCLEVMTFAAIALITTSTSVLAVAAALRYLLMSTIGSLAYLMGVALLYSAYGVLDLNILSSLIKPNCVSEAAISFILVGLLVKAAVFPFHFWLPPAHSKAPAPVSALLSALVVMAAFYLFIEFWFQYFPEILTPLIGQLIGILALVSIFYGSIRALFEKRLKLLIAYSTISQVGFMFLIFPLTKTGSTGNQFAWNGAIYFALSHAFAKASLFMVSGSLFCALKSDRIEGLRGTANQLPLVIFTFALAGLTIIGLPPSGGFIGKWQLMKAAIFSDQWWYALLMVAGSLLTACYVIRVLEVALTKPEREIKENVSLFVPASMQASAFLLAVIALLMGIFSSVPLNMLNISYKGS